MDRLLTIREVVAPSQGAARGHESAEQKHRRRRVQQKLEMSFARQAQIVFTTLGSSTKRAFAREGLVFEVIVNSDSRRVRHGDLATFLRYLGPSGDFCALRRLRPGSDRRCLVQ